MLTNVIAGLFFRRKSPLELLFSSREGSKRIMAALCKLRDDPHFGKYNFAYIVIKYSAFHAKCLRERLRIDVQTLKRLKMFSLEKFNVCSFDDLLVELTAFSFFIVLRQEEIENPHAEGVLNSVTAFEKHTIGALGISESVIRSQCGLQPNEALDRYPKGFLSDRTYWYQKSLKEHRSVLECFSSCIIANMFPERVPDFSLVAPILHASCMQSIPTHYHEELMIMCKDIYGIAYN